MSAIDLDDMLLIAGVEQFYFREARMLDERHFQQWLAFLDPQIEFLMPSRHIPFPDQKLRDTEAFSAIERELERGAPDGTPLREESFMHLAARVMRAYKMNAWAEVPPPRTRRLITNVEVEPQEDGTLRTFSNFHLFYSHDGADNHHYVGCRRDLLKKADDGFRIRRREVIMDWNIVTAPTLSLLF